MTNQPNASPGISETLLSSEQAAIAFSLPFYYFRNPYKRNQLRIPHYYINKLVRYKLEELRVWHAQLGEILKAQEEASPNGVSDDVPACHLDGEVANA